MQPSQSGWSTISKTATGQRAIDEMVMSLGYEEVTTELFSVDSQFSHGGGVIIMVTGALQMQGMPRRPFVQTFFLATQDHGYYVLNDIFRHTVPAASLAGVVANKPLDGENTVSTGTVNPPLGHHPPPPPPPPPPAHSSGNTSPRSDGDRVRATTTPALEDGRPTAARTPSSGSELSLNFVAEEYVTNRLFIKEVPARMSEKELAELLENQFGPVKVDGGVRLKPSRGKDSLAFVIFESVESAQACVAAGIDIDGKHLKPIPNKPYVTRYGGARGITPSGGTNATQRSTRGNKGRDGVRNAMPPFPLPFSAGPLMIPPQQQQLRTRSRSTKVRNNSRSDQNNNST